MPATRTITTAVTITLADSHNLKRLSEGLPSHEEAFHRYANEHGYWDDVQQRIGGK